MKEGRKEGRARQITGRKKEEGRKIDKHEGRKEGQERQITGRKEGRMIGKEEGGTKKKKKINGTKKER